MELFLVYLWLKLDTIHTNLIVVSAILLVVYTGMLVYWLDGGPEHRKEDKQIWWAENKKFKQIMHRLLGLFVVFYSINFIAPSAKDVAILVGTSIAIDIVKSPEGNKISQLIRGKANELLDEELKKLSKEGLKK